MYALKGRPVGGEPVDVDGRVAVPPASKLLQVEIDFGAGKAPSPAAPGFRSRP